MINTVSHKNENVKKSNSYSERFKGCMSFTRLPCISTYHFILQVKCHIAHIENSNKSSEERENRKIREENETERKRELKITVKGRE